MLEVKSLNSPLAKYFLYFPGGEGILNNRPLINKSLLSFRRRQGSGAVFLGEFGNLKYEKVTWIFKEILYFFGIKLKYGEEEAKKSTLRGCIFFQVQHTYLTCTIPGARGITILR